MTSKKQAGKRYFSVKIEAILSSEISLDFYQTSRHHIPEVAAVGTSYHTEIYASSCLCFKGPSAIVTYSHSGLNPRFLRIQNVTA
jgi:hypothetical protein